MTPNRTRSEPRSSSLDVAMFCDLHGIIQEFLLDSLRAAGRAEGHPFLALFDRHSHEKAESFLAALRIEGSTAGWELTSAVSYGLLPMVFTGLQSEGRLLIIGARTHSELERIVSELTSLNNEQTTTIRSLLKQHQHKPTSRRERDHLDRFSEMNNELMNAQRELQKRALQLERLNEEKNHFLAMAAHDLRNPLTLISGYSELMKQGERPEEDLIILDEIHRSSRFMMRLIDDLLDISKIEAGKYDLQLVSTDIGVLVRESLERLRIAAKQKGLKIEFEIIGAPARVEVDPLKIEQILSNLVLNAVKYSNSGSIVRVTVSARPAEVEIAVADQGKGIPAEELEHVFQPFQRFASSGTAGEKSTGVGLMIIKRLVEMHGGRVWAESIVDRGSTFHVTLPTSQP